MRRRRSAPSRTAGIPGSRRCANVIEGEPARCPGSTARTGGSTCRWRSTSVLVEPAYEVAASSRRRPGQSTARSTSEGRSTGGRDRARTRRCTEDDAVGPTSAATAARPVEAGCRDVVHRERRPAVLQRARGLDFDHDGRTHRRGRDDADEPGLAGAVHTGSRRPRLSNTGLAPPARQAAFDSSASATVFSMMRTMRSGSSAIGTCPQCGQLDVTRLGEALPCGLRLGVGQDAVPRAPGDRGRHRHLAVERVARPRHGRPLERRGCFIAMASPSSAALWRSGCAYSDQPIEPAAHRCREEPQHRLGGD